MSLRPIVRRTLSAAGLLIGLIVLLGFRSIDWFLLKKSLRHKFAKVDWISTDSLASWLSDKKRTAPILLDVRTEAEWKVSHLAGARRVEPGASLESAAAALPKDTPIVTYCAVGYRSGELAERLRIAGFTNVQNLEGSIFQWANERRPLVRGNETVTTVHPYNNFWGRLLNDDARAALK